MSDKTLYINAICGGKQPPLIKKLADRGLIIADSNQNNFSLRWNRIALSKLELEELKDMYFKLNSDSTDKSSAVTIQLYDNPITIDDFNIDDYQ